jgi:carbon starvation protein CstA
VKPSRLAAGAAVLAAAAVLLSPFTCVQGSHESRPRCSTVLGYWTPFGEATQLLVLVAVWLAVAAVRRARANRRTALR